MVCGAWATRASAALGGAEETVAGCGQEVSSQICLCPFTEIRLRFVIIGTTHRVLTTDKVLF